MAQLRVILNRAETTVENNIAYLRNNGYIERVGSRKNGYWKGHCGSMSELTDDKWEELCKLICKVETCLKTVLGVTLCNWSCFMNNFYKESEPNFHLHIHVRPRYDEPVMVNGRTYIDSEFGHHYAVKKAEKYPTKIGKKCSLG